MRLISFGIMFLIFFIHIFGARFIAKTGIVMLCFVFISILSILAGLFSSNARTS